VTLRFRGTSRPPPLAAEPILGSDRSRTSPGCSAAQTRAVVGKAGPQGPPPLAAGASPPGSGWAWRSLGLNLVTAPDIEAAEGDDLEVTADKVGNKTTGRTFVVVPLPKARQAIIDAGGLIAYTRRRVMEAAGRA
jgi:hypothetical protein